MFSLRGNYQCCNMSANTPVIKFSPFKALFIGEKNRILKQQPMKNTIFITRINQKRKNFNPRDLFDLGVSKNKDVTLKIPQRFCHFFKHKLLQGGINKPINNGNCEIICYKFEGKSFITKYNKTLPEKANNIKIKPIKLKLKRKLKYKDNIKDKIVKKFPQGSPKRTCYNFERMSHAFKNRKQNSDQSRYLSNKYEKRILDNKNNRPNSNRFNTRQEYLHQLYLKKNQQFLTNIHVNRCEISPEIEIPYSVKISVKLRNMQFDVTAPETLLDEISKEYHKNNCYEDFQFPKFPEELNVEDFENDSYLIDIIYENFPKIVKFANETQSNDFSKALIDSGLLPLEKCMKGHDYEIKDENTWFIFKSCFPLLKLKKTEDGIPHYIFIENDRNFNHAENNLHSLSYGDFFFKNEEQKNITIESLMQPFLQSSWFETLPSS